MRRTLITVAGAVTSAVAAGLPWATTGRVSRTGFQLARALDQAGLADTDATRTLVVAVALLPVLAAAAWVAGSLHRPRLLATLGAAAGLVAGSSAALVLRSPVRAGVGVYLALVGTVLCLGGAVSLVKGERG